MRSAFRRGHVQHLNRVILPSISIATEKVRAPVGCTGGVPGERAILRCARAAGGIERHDRRVLALPPGVRRLGRFGCGALGATLATIISGASIGEGGFALIGDPFILVLWRCQTVVK